MATMTSKQFCERMYGMYNLLGGGDFGCAHCSDNRFSCGYRKENTVLTNALMRRAIITKFLIRSRQTNIVSIS